MNTGSLILIVTFAVCSLRAGTVDFELAKLEAALQAANTQMDMNIRSGEIGVYLDRKLTRLEDRIRKDLDTEGLKLFEKAAAAWREYRQAQALFEGDTYRGGSMRPLVHNSVFARITQERISALESVDPEGRYRE